MTSKATMNTVIFEVGDRANFQINHEGEFLNGAYILFIEAHTITFDYQGKSYIMPRALMELGGACELVEKYADMQSQLRSLVA